MINIFVTYRCNLSCSYCFAHELRREYPVDLQEGSFRKLLQWMKRSALPTAAFLGGEPTLHQGLAAMIEETTAAGIDVVLFTNGLFPGFLADRLCRTVANFVVNFNDPETYSAESRSLLHASLAHLAERRARITFSKNFSSENLAYDYLLEGAARYGVRSVRYDLSRPSATGENGFVGIAAARSLMAHVTGFVRACAARGLRTGLDCCVRLCDMSAEDRRYLEQVSMKFRGICHPSIDIHPDLSASYCLPLRNVQVPDVTRFANSERLMQHFSAAVHATRYDEASAECRACPDFKRFCQGGCLALQRQARHAAFPASGYAGPGVIDEPT